jgi:predicted XRE-type DNA-binding protein
MRYTTMNKENEVFHGSNNVFADLGLPDAVDMLVKAELARKILSIIKGRRLTQARAAERLGIDQPKVVALARGKLGGLFPRKAGSLP